MKIVRETFHWRFPLFHEVVVAGLWPRIEDAAIAGIMRRKLARRFAQSPFPIPHKVEIEVFNRCNNTCPFCPVNRDVDPRKPLRMTDETFESIVEQLGRIEFTGRLALHSNNEPLLDKRIETLARLAKDRVPHALLYLQTNGTQLTIGRFVALMRSLDRIVINNYEDDLRMLDPVREVYEYCLGHEWVNDRVTIHMKRMHIKRSNRAGKAPNKKGLDRSMRSPCLRPFYEMIIRPDGKVSLCCFDAIGRTTMGDVASAGLLEVWRGEELARIRRTMISDRDAIPLCRHCDEVIIGESLAVVEQRSTAKNLGGLLRSVLPSRARVQ